MVSKSKKENAGKKKKVKVLNLNKETVKSLTDDEAKRVKGGLVTAVCYVNPSPSTIRPPGPKPSGVTSAFSLG